MTSPGTPLDYEVTKEALRELDRAVSLAVVQRDDSPALETLVTEQARIHLAHPEAFR